MSFKNLARGGPVSPIAGRVFSKTRQQHKERLIKMTQQQETGVVKWFDQKKGFGFIVPDEGQGDLFVHISALERSGLKNLQEGQSVAFDRAKNPRNGKISAENLKAI